MGAGVVLESDATVTFGPPGFGLALRQAREARGLTLRELAQTTAIRRDYLQALEDARLDGLPEPTFARAYLRRYARELALNPEPLLADFDRLIHPLPPQVPAPAEARTDEDSPPPLGPVRIALIAALLGLLLLVGVLLRAQAPAVVRPPMPVPAPVPAGPQPTPPAPLPQPPPPVPGAANTVRLTVQSIPDGAQVYLDNRNLGPAPVRSFPVEARGKAQLRVEAAGRTPLKQTIDLRQGRNLRATLPASATEPSATEPSVLTDLTTGIKTFTPLPPPPPRPSATPPSPTAAVSVTFTGQSWTRVTASDGQVLYEGVPPAGSVKGFPAGVTIRAGNAAAVRVSLGGTPDAAMGEAGQVVTRRY